MKFWIKVSSVVLAVALWMFVISRGQSQVAMEVRIGFENMPLGLQVVEGQSTTVTTVGIKGHERFLKGLSPEDVRVSLDMDDVTRGRRLYNIEREDVRLPTPLKLISVNPSTVLLTVEEVAEKRVPVTAALTGTPAEGFSVRAVEVTPAEITIRGVRSELRRLRELRTEPVDITSAGETVTREVKVEVPANNLRIGVSTVIVRVVIGEEGR